MSAVLRRIGDRIRTAIRGGETPAMQKADDALRLLQEANRRTMRARQAHEGTGNFVRDRITGDVHRRSDG